MANIIRIKRSTTSGNPSTLGVGELAYSSLSNSGFTGGTATGGGMLYIGTGSETTGNASVHTVIGGVYYTAAIDAATNANTASTLVKRDASGNFTAGTITVGGANFIKSTVANGVPGSVVKMKNKVYFGIVPGSSATTGVTLTSAAVDGGFQAMQMFLSAGNHKTDTQQVRNGS